MQLVSSDAACSEEACVHAVCNSAGTQVAVNAAGQAATTKTPPPPPAAPKSNVTGTTPVSLLTCSGNNIIQCCLPYRHIDLQLLPEF